jgi:dsRNA-specific ribonuclease
LKDAKSRLQEEAQALGIGLPQYQVSSNKEGNLFNCRVKFNDEIFNASDPIKKDAEQKVAELILHKMGKS